MAEPAGATIGARIRRHLRRRWRPLLRALHRDAGYLVIGLTYVYAVSGIAINHVGEIDPNFKTVETTHTISTSAITREDEEAAGRAVLAALSIEDPLRDAIFVEGDRLEVFLDRRELEVDLGAGLVRETRQEPRFFVRVANWLHYNRGKAAWTVIADGYALVLLFLATSGVFMLRGRKGFVGRGAVLITAGALVPILYVSLAGGPGS